MRINKYLASKGLASRRKIDELVAAGRVYVNGEEAKLGVGLKAGDTVKALGKSFTFSEEKEARILVAFNKPPGIVCTSERQEKNNLINFLKDNPENFLGTKERYQTVIQTRLFSIGRLDKESRGLILLTNDGDLSQKLTHPKYEKEKEYVVTCQREVDDEFIYKFSHGVTILLEDETKEVTTKKCKVQRISEDKFSCVLKQGYKRQIRLMVRALGNNVADLERIRIADLSLENLDQLEESHFMELGEQFSI